MMKRFPGFGALRRSPTEEMSVASPPQCFPQLYSPARDWQRRRRSVDRRVADVREAAEEGVGAAARRRSVDDSRPGESVDLQAVRREWKNSTPAAATMSSSSDHSFSSSSETTLSSSRASDASDTTRDTTGHTTRDTRGDIIRDTIRETRQDTIRQGHNGAGIRVVVVGFDANAKESAVGATATWAFQNSTMHSGDALVLVGVMDTVRGPLGYKVLVDDQTWLGANMKFLDAEIRAKNSALARQFAGLRKLCADAGVTLSVDVSAAARPEVAIVHEATTRGAAHVVLDKSLHNRRRRYYLERLACDVTRMRRSGGVDTIRTRPPSSPTSVLLTTLPRPPRNSSSRLVKLAEQKNPTTESISSRRQCIPSDDDEEELFCIDHAFLTRRVEMLLEPEPEHDWHRRRHDQLIVAADDGYESDDLFSLAGDGASRRPSIAVFAMDSARASVVARSSISRVVTQLATG